MAELFEIAPESERNAILKEWTSNLGDDVDDAKPDSSKPNVFSYAQLKEFDNGLKRSKEGKLVSYLAHTKLEDGDIFGSWYKEFESSITELFIKFLERVFPLTVHQEYSLMCASAPKPAGALANTNEAQVPTAQASILGTNPDSATSLSSSQRVDENTPSFILFPDMPGSIHSPSQGSSGDSRATLSSLSNVPATSNQNLSASVVQAPVPVPVLSNSESVNGQNQSTSTGGQRLTAYEDKHEENIACNHAILTMIDAQLMQEYCNQGIPVLGPLAPKPKEKQTQHHRPKGVDKLTQDSEVDEDVEMDKGPSKGSVIREKHINDIEKPAVEKPATTEKPAIEEPAVEEPAVKECTFEEGHINGDVRIVEVEDVHIEAAIEEEADVDGIDIVQERIIEVGADWALVERAKAAVIGAIDLPDWILVVKEYVLLETLLAGTKESKHNLKAAKRLTEIGEWLKCKHILEKPLTIKNVNDFSDTFCAWWTSLHPKWRGEEWPLAHGAQAKEGSEKHVIESALGDMEWTLGQVIGSLQNHGKKHAANKELKGIPKRTKF
ncbi:hypothetical protein OF83DRAFT_1087782 [Amylostereum chailletii]|nr:hypothetical protein OF83DRAFT_1087782 [Amylostereum chailletii]